MHFNGPSAHGFTVRIDTPDWERDLRAHPPRGGDRRRPWRPILDPARRVAQRRRADRPGCPIESMQSTFFVDRAIEYLKEKHDRPFAMIVSFYEPHSPFNFPRAGRTIPPRPVHGSSVSEQDRRRAARDLRPAHRRRCPRDPGCLLHVAFLRGFSGRPADRGPRRDRAVGPDARWFTSATMVTCSASMDVSRSIVSTSRPFGFPMIMRWPGHIEGAAASSTSSRWSTSCRRCSISCDLPVPPDCRGSTSSRCSWESRVPRLTTWSSASISKTKKRWCDRPVTS